MSSRLCLLSTCLRHLIKFYLKKERGENFSTLFKTFFEALAMPSIITNMTFEDSSLELGNTARSMNFDGHVRSI